MGAGLDAQRHGDTEHGDSRDPWTMVTAASAPLRAFELLSWAANLVCFTKPAPTGGTVAEVRTQVKRPHGLETQQALLVAAGQVFSRLAYSEARLKDIAEAAGISQGALYFHFGNKEDVAQAVLDAQQERMRAVLDDVTSRVGTELDRMLRLFDGLGHLVSSDELVQAGIRLSMQPGTGLDARAIAPYKDWVAVASAIIREGIADGSMSPDLNADASAELVNEIFVGAQTLAGIEDRWESLPRRVAAARSVIAMLLTGSSQV